MTQTKRKKFVLPTIRHLLVELILKAKAADDPKILDELLSEVLPKIQSCFRYADQLITEKDAATLYPRLFNVVKLRNMRARGIGPAFVKFGQFRNGRIFYRIRAIETWIEQHEGFQEEQFSSFEKCA